MRRDMGVNTAYQVWVRAADRLLETRFGIQQPKELANREEWGIWHGLLGTPSDQQLYGSVLVRGAHTSGWLGLVALQVVPALRNRYYIGLVTLLIAAGLIDDFLLARGWGNPFFDIINRTRCVLDDIPGQKDEGPPEGRAEGE